MANAKTKERERKRLSRAAHEAKAKKNINDTNGGAKINHKKAVLITAVTTCAHMNEPHAHPRTQARCSLSKGCKGACEWQ